MTKERRHRRAGRVDEWAVVVRLYDDRLLYWCGEEAKRLGQNWGPRSSQAHRFATREAAERYAATCETNSTAREYEAVLLAQS